ncbi:MAG TPA: heme o synthase [Gemmataceae bacterium]|nr:heme o synthase [Gemmataceae bacterium]
MKAAATAVLEPAAPARSRAADYVALCKPRVAVLVLFTVAAGGLLASNGRPDWLLLLHTVLGTGLVAAGTSALNQLLERRTDALMRRTENRPLPAGRLHAAEVLAFGGALAAVGLTYLLAAAGPWPAAVCGGTFLLYVFVYTPLKRVTTFNTVIGAVPGALPPVIGWVAVRGSLGEEALALFLIVFLWQVPHFLAIAWIYREDYGRAGLRMLPVADPDGRATGRRMVSWSLALLVASVAPVVIGVAGAFYLVGALALGVAFLCCAAGFKMEAGTPQARRVLRASLLYLPALFALLVLDAGASALWP